MQKIGQSAEGGVVVADDGTPYRDPTLEAAQRLEVLEREC